MVGQLYCLKSSSGMPLFIRKRGDKEPISFSQIASVNGVYMFAKSHGMLLKNVSLDDSVVAWKDFNESIMLIAIAPGVNAATLERFMETVYSALVLVVGIDELTTVKNAERLKRELRVTYRLVDKLLDSLDCAEKTIVSRGNPTPAKPSNAEVSSYVETILCQENQTLSNCLENYMDVVESAYGCVSMHGRIAVATQNWWELSKYEKRLLSLLVCTVNAQCSATDIPVFLPSKSPAVPFRLVSLRLVGGIDISALCGPHPTLSEIEQTALHVWRPVVDVLRAAEKTYPRNFPLSMVLDKNVLGFMIINLKMGKFLISRNLSTKESCSLSGSHRLNVLKTFYNQSASIFLEGFHDVKTKAKEVYWCSEYHKCHGLREGDNVICLLYAASVSSHTMRLLSNQSLKILTGDKSVSW